MIQKILIFSFVLFMIQCNDNMQLESPSNNQPIRDLIDNNETNSTSNTYRQPSTVSSTNSTGAAGNTTAGAVGTPPASPTTGSATGGYSGYPTTSGY
ncbi:MAG: hypothetical protein KBF99_07410 [Leptospiraceae bacterium]|nr:hypothetical protein [Leptospiraceae bacterium]MBL0263568.1 hypothetical protein [Leptospiraceae bacterium]MBP9162994.1 hypothetical protein [Leptospiraceae bacterium]